MGPLRRRSWAPRGHTPQLRQRGRAWRKVSVIGALVISPRRHRVRGYFGVLPDANYDGEAVLAFVKELRRTLRRILRQQKRCLVIHPHRFPIDDKRRTRRLLRPRRGERKRRRELRSVHPSRGARFWQVHSRGSRLRSAYCAT